VMVLMADRMALPSTSSWLVAQLLLEASKAESNAMDQCRLPSQSNLESWACVGLCVSEERKGGFLS
jgi:hypothetical protein